MNSFFSVLIIFTLFLSGCSGSSSDSVDNELFGMWFSPCHVFDWTGQPSRTYIEFSKFELRSGSIYFNDNNCIEESSGIETTESVMPYRLGQEIMTFNGNKATELDVDVFIDNEFIFTFKDIVSVINSQLYFGIEVPDEECLVFDPIVTGSDVLGICTQRPTVLNFEWPSSKQI